ncbi:GGDEF domain-containing phosphodiesterase, partial [Actibacterium sp. MT2.3-13A]|uniref:GGDEF domain-containing phosphodiesterase n=1 Tax=Actibacterium sp. MT2.3-13A TaxID=2828332 RepID=UPI001BA72640
AAARDPAAGQPPRQAVIAALDRALADRDGRNTATACLALELEGLEKIERRLGRAAADVAPARAAERLLAALRGSDLLGRLDRARFAVALGPMPRADAGALTQIAGGLQDALDEPLVIGGGSARLTCSIGFCLPERSPGRDGAALLTAAETALREARRHGPGAIRAFSRAMQVSARFRSGLADEVAEALDRDQIRPWFQPQTSTDTGAVTGFEALAHWRHPTHGVIPPEAFLPVIVQTGLSGRLNDRILVHTLSALRSWDKAGLNVPAVGINVSGPELRDPGTAERIIRTLDRFGVAPGRLTLEVVESVLSGADDDIVARNIAALAQRGCGIDLDHFGTGEASLAAIRRFAVSRLKIDRAFIARVDRDRAQQDMVAGILMMCERLGLGTLATGVERVGEHALLAQLGCGHVQGHGIGQPLPFEDTLAWMRGHNGKLQRAVRLGLQAG